MFGFMDNEPLVIHAYDGSISSNEEFHDSNAQSVDELDDYTRNVTESEKKAHTRKRWDSKKNDTEYQRLFSENKHLFDMSCDCCSTLFESLNEARAHYLNEHNNPKGYIKSNSGKKMIYRSNVVQYLERHSNPEKFKYVCENLYLNLNSETNQIYLFLSDVWNAIAYSQLHLS